METLPRLRLIAATFFAVAVSLPMAWISLAKLVLFLAALAVVVCVAFRPARDQPLSTPLWVWLVYGAVTYFALSLLWTEVPPAFALQVLVKHAKLVAIVFLVYLLCTPQESATALRWFFGAQSFVLFSALLLAAGVALPWVASDSMEHVVFSQSYIDQSIMLACTAAMAWHLAGTSTVWRRLAGLFAALAIAEVVLFLPGRTGYLVVFMLCALALYWEIPVRLRMRAVLAGMAIAAGFAVLVPRPLIESMQDSLNHGFGQRSAESVSTSNNWRVNAWQRSLQAMQGAPLKGAGVGSWSPAVKRMQGADAQQVFGLGNASNPHQEFLLWGVELGVPGLLLLLALFGTLSRQALVLETRARRATLSVLLTMLVACSFNSALFDDLLGDYLCAALGLAIAFGRTRELLPATIAT